MDLAGILLMDEILHHFYSAGHPFQTLNLNIAVLAMLRKCMCVNDRNPASPARARNIEIRGVRGARLPTVAHV